MSCHPSADRLTTTARVLCLLINMVIVYGQIPYDTPGQATSVAAANPSNTSAPASPSPVVIPTPVPQSTAPNSSCIDPQAGDVYFLASLDFFEWRPVHDFITEATPALFRWNGNCSVSITGTETFYSGTGHTDKICDATPANTFACAVAAGSNLVRASANYVPSAEGESVTLVDKEGGMLSDVYSTVKVPSTANEFYLKKTGQGYCYVTDIAAVESEYGSSQVACNQSDSASATRWKYEQGVMLSSDGQIHVIKSYATADLAALPANRSHYVAFLLISTETLSTLMDSTPPPPVTQIKLSFTVTVQFEQLACNDTVIASFARHIESAANYMLDGHIFNSSASTTIPSCADIRVDSATSKGRRLLQLQYYVDYETTIEADDRNWMKIGAWNSTSIQALVQQWMTEDDFTTNLQRFIDSEMYDGMQFQEGQQAEIANTPVDTVQVISTAPPPTQPLQPPVSNGTAPAPSPAPDNSNTASSSPPPAPNVGAIAGGVVGGVVLVAAIAGGLLYRRSATRASMPAK